MASRAVRLLLAVGAVLRLAAVFGLAAGPGLAAAPAAVPSGFVGMNVDGPMYPDTAPGINLAAQFAAMHAAGVQSVRVAFAWSQAQPYPNWSVVPAGVRGNYTNAGGVPTDFAPIDELVSLAARHRMTLLPTVLYAPSWDITGQGSEGLGRPARDGPYAAFLTDLVDRYGPGGSFWAGRAGLSEPIREWQIWNEPDIPYFWPAQPFARTYVALLIAAHRAIKQADPGAEVVLAGEPNDSWSELETVYQVNGARAAFDAVGVHPYTATAAGVITILHYVREVMDAHGDAAKPLIADEVGWPSAKGVASNGSSPGLLTTEAGQARATAAVLPLRARARASLNLASFDYYTWAGVETPGGYAFSFAGLFKYLAGRLTAKPAFAAFARAALAIEHGVRH
ncbi:MAG: hypothetical protein ACLP8S_14055 [Solirubrobacteraceae bacterium]